MALGLALGVLLAAWAGPVGALPLLSEVYYDAVGSDDGQVFVELSGAPGTSLAGWTLEGINGADGQVTASLLLSGTIGANGLFVVGDLAAGGGSSVIAADLLRDFDFQNGPDSVVLRDPAGRVADALGYGSFGPGSFFAGEGAAAPDAPAGSSLARISAFADSGDNALDFAVMATPTPGVAPGMIPEPRSALLLAAGLLGLAGWRRLLG